MASSAAYLPFHVVYVPIALVGRAVAWLARGYRTAPALERALIFPTWAVLRGFFIVGWGLAHLLHALGGRASGPR